MSVLWEVCMLVRVASISYWLHPDRDATGKFPDYPDVDEGGSSVLFKKREEGVSLSSTGIMGRLLEPVGNV